MECPWIEARLSEYAERTLPATEMTEVEKHLQLCAGCSVLFEDMRQVLTACSAFPVLEPDIALIDRILLRTSGRPRTRSLKELLLHNFIQPMLTPRFAVGVALAAMFAVLVLNLMAPRMNSLATALSPEELFRDMDRGVQQLYSEGLKAYDKKNEWQAQFTFFKNNVLNKLGFMIEQLDVPAEDSQKSAKPRKEQEKTRSEKSSVRSLPA